MEKHKKLEDLFDRVLVWEIYKPLTVEELKMVEKLKKSMRVEIIKMYEEDTPQQI